MYEFNRQVMSDNFSIGRKRQQRAIAELTRFVNNESPENCEFAGVEHFLPHFEELFALSDDSRAIFAAVETMHYIIILRQPYILALIKASKRLT